MLILMWGGPLGGQTMSYQLELTEPGAIVSGADYEGGDYRIIARLPADSRARYLAGWTKLPNIQPARQLAALAIQHALDQATIGNLEDALVRDRVTIADLESDAAILRRRIANLEVALVSARRIGGAMGLIMALRRVSDAEAFDVLREASRNTHRKLRDVADDVLLLGRAS